MAHLTSSSARADARLVRLCNIHEIADGAARGFDPFGKRRDALVLIRQGSSIKAYKNLCPHQGASLPWRKDAYLSGDGTRIVCSAHGAQFDIQTGECLLGAALGHSLEAIDIVVGDDGTVRALLPTRD